MVLSDEERKRKKREYQRKYRANPDNKTQEKRDEYRSRPEVKAKEKARSSSYGRQYYNKKTDTIN